MSCRKPGIIAAAALFLAALLILGGGSLAYFTGADRKESRFPTGQSDAVAISLIEPRWRSPVQGMGLLPGDVVGADPTIVNREDPVYLRIAVRITDAVTGSPLDSRRAAHIFTTLRYTGTETPGGPFTSGELEQAYPMHYNTGEFQYDSSHSDPGQGLYYFTCSRVVESGEALTLYDTVVVPADWDSQDTAYAGNFILTLRGEALHADNARYEGVSDIAEAMEVLHSLMGGDTP